MCTRGTASVAAGCFQISNSHSFLKDGRKISIGDCAFFKPPQDSPPFIGIIRCLITEKETHLQFTVNWLYRASEVELEKGTEVEAAPNEIFYSFHEDKVPAASLLHPCKVAFLPKGVELPSGISSFICRRVYDINKKCLWWLTDQNYVDKHQKEVNQLLSKTHRAMDETVQTGACSPKTMNSLALTTASHAKPGTDSPQNGLSLSSHGKGKKSEKAHQDHGPLKRLQKVGVGESPQLNQESNIKEEIARITDHGGLVNYESVEKLVQLMAPSKSNKKINVAERLMLAAVVDATNKFDCLSWFLQLKGLPVFDLWLQEVHKGKINDLNTQKDDEKTVDEFLLVLLGALDKLPVNLSALQMCNIGKSVNRLRSHKNSEIQRKARSLVDTWKKRVEAEMNIDEGKPGSSTNVAWHGRHTSESSQGGYKKFGSGENAVKSTSSSHYSSPKTVPQKPAQVEPSQTSASMSQENSKSTVSPSMGVVNSKKAQLNATSVNESSDQLLMTVYDEKSSSSSQSRSQSYSSDHIKTVESAGKDDTGSSPAESEGPGNMLRRTSRATKKSSSLLDIVSHGSHTDSGLNRDPYLNKSLLSTKLSNTGSVNEKMDNVSAAHGNSNKLIVKIPNLGSSHTVKYNDGSGNEQGLSKSQAMSPACPDKHVKLDYGSKAKGVAIQLNDVSDVTTKSRHSGDLKDVLTGSGEADGSTAANHDKVLSANRDHARRTDELPKYASSSAAHETKPWKCHGRSFSPINALIESCVKHSEANALISGVDDVGINLLASVATCEMSKCDSLATNSLVNTTVAEDSEKSLNMESNTQKPTSGTDNMKLDTEKYEVSTPLVTNSREVEPSTNAKLDTILSDIDLPKKQDEQQMCVTRDTALSEVSIELPPENHDDNQNENSKKEVTRETYVQSCGGSNLGIKNRTSEEINGVVLLKESLSTSHSDPVGPNDVPRTPSAAEACLDSPKAVGMVVEMLNQKKIIYDGSSHRKMNQNQSKSECEDMGFNVADSSRTCKEGISQNKEFLSHCNDSSDFNSESVIKTVETTSTNVCSASPTPGMGKLKFDLNEGLMADEIQFEEQKSILQASCPVDVHVISPVPFPVSTMSNGLPAPVTIAAAVKRPFVPLEDLFVTREEPRWKCSAATSAFRPPERRKISENFSTCHSIVPSKSTSSFLDIDLNIADDSLRTDMVSQSRTSILPRNNTMPPVCGIGVFDLDLNQAGDTNEVGAGHSIGVTIGKLENYALQSKLGKPSNGDSSASRNFDLNNEPCLDEEIAEASMIGQNVWGTMPSRPPVVSLRMNNAEMGNTASWFPQSTSIPGVLPGRGDYSFPFAQTGIVPRMYYTPPGSNHFPQDVYRAHVQSSSPMLLFPPSSYQCPMVPFGSSYPLPSATISGSALYLDSSSGGRHNHTTSQSNFLGHPGVLSCSYPQPYLVNIPDGMSNGGLEISNRWGTPGLDLNTGPASIDAKSRNDPSTFALRQFSVANSEAFSEEQKRMFHESGAVPVLKRKEPDGGWDAGKPLQRSWH